MGHLTKSKGRVTEADIHIASRLMDRINEFTRRFTYSRAGAPGRKADNYPYVKDTGFSFVASASGVFDLSGCFRFRSGRRLPMARYT